MEYVSPRQTSGPRPWSALPPELPGILAPAVPPLAAELMTLLPQQVPAYAAATEGRYWEKLARGVDIALARLVALPGTDEPALNEESRRLVSGLGTGEFREGRSMDSLLAAYRAGARLAFRVLSEECLDAGMSPAVTISLGESIWAYIDELSSVSAQAYAAELSAQAGLRERRHAELLETLLRGGADDVEIRRLATAADWRLPSRIAVVVLPTVAAARARLQLGATGLVVERDSEATALVAAPERPHHETRLLRMLARTEAVVGPPVDWSDAPHSHRVAQFLASWRARRTVHAPDEERAPLLADDHLTEVLMGVEPRLVGRLAARALAPLEAVSDRKRAVFEQTLLSWLRHRGQRAPMAAELGVHTQTVGYRVRRLRELFGDALDDPDERFRLEIALRGCRGLRPAHPGA